MHHDFVLAVVKTKHSQVYCRCSTCLSMASLNALKTLIFGHVATPKSDFVHSFSVPGALLYYWDCNSTGVLVAQCLLGAVREILLLPGLQGRTRNQGAGVVVSLGWR